MVTMALVRYCYNMQMRSWLIQRLLYCALLSKKNKKKQWAVVTSALHVGERRALAWIYGEYFFFFFFFLLNL